MNQTATSHYEQPQSAGGHLHLSTAQYTALTPSGSLWATKLPAMVFTEETEALESLMGFWSAFDFTSSYFYSELSEEVLRMTKFPGVAFRGPRSYRRAWTVQAGLDVWEIIEAYQATGYQALLEEGQIEKEVLDLALRYYEAYPEEINSALAENKRTPREWHELFPDVIPAPNQS